MGDVHIRFEREKLDGIVAVGSYLLDVIKRFGIKLHGDCITGTALHECEVIITKGSEFLSPLTLTEMEHFGADGRKNQMRLACQAKIEHPGEIVVMTKEKKEEPKVETKSDEYRKEFSDLPLEKKIADLVQLEAIALGETFSYVVNSPFKVFEKIGDVMAEFGMKLEKEAKKAGRPPEPEAEASAEKDGAPKAKKRPTGKRTTNRKTGDQ